MKCDERPQRVCRDTKLIFERAPRSPQWSEDDYVMLADGTVVGRIKMEHGGPKGSPWFWMLMYDQCEDRSPTEGYAATREEARAALAESWRRE